MISLFQMPQSETTPFCGHYCKGVCNLSMIGISQTVLPFLTETISVFTVIDANSWALPERNNATPFVFVADDAFVLSRNIMNSFQENQLKDSKQINFNY